ncbi:MAG: hypothetical protein KDA69_17085 [Planctomycetaceae bacterium]|nr:hypothetical protein [Planctomycetaceae bacterium]MCA9046046.1 hypothetical protein [Planctomycetaceae bacterium]MCB9949643.1 hypothetical protein [Planctomycetaceae bacterium]
MYQDEAVEFINKQVHVSLKSWATRFGVVIGITNLIALIGLCAGVIHQANTAAELVVQNRINADEELDEKLKNLRDNMRQAHEDNMAQLHLLAGRMEAMNANLDHRQAVIATKEKQIDEDLQRSLRRIRELAKKIDAVYSGDDKGVIQFGQLLEKSMKDGSLESLLQSIEVLSDNEIRLGEITFVWDTLKMDDVSSNTNVRVAQFEFPHPFEHEPVFLPTVTAQSNFEAFAIHNVEVTNSRVTISVNEIQERETTAAATLSYLAIGRLAQRKQYSSTGSTAE